MVTSIYHYKIIKAHLVHSSWTEIWLAWLKFSEEAGVSSIIFQDLTWNLIVEWGELKPGWMAGPEGSGQWHQGLIIPYPWSVLQGRHWAPSCAPASLMVWRVGCAFCSFADDTEMGGAPEVVLPSRWPQKSWRNGLAAASCRALPQGRNSHWDWLGSSLAEKAVGVLVTWQLLYFEFCLPHVKSELRDLLRDCRAVYVPPILRTVAALPGTGDVC